MSKTEDDDARAEKDLLDEARRGLSLGAVDISRATEELISKRRIAAAEKKLLTTLISFCDGSYKEVRSLSWKHSQWIHFTLADGSTVAANPANVNYLHIGCGD